MPASSPTAEARNARLKRERRELLAEAARAREAIQDPVDYRIARTPARNLPETSSAPFSFVASPGQTIKTSQARKLRADLASIVAEPRTGSTTPSAPPPPLSEGYSPGDYEYDRAAEATLEPEPELDLGTPDRRSRPRQLFAETTATGEALQSRAPPPVADSEAATIANDRTAETGIETGARTLAGVASKMRGASPVVIAQMVS